MIDGPNPSPPRRRWWSLCVVALAIFTVTADAGQLNIALPATIGEFRADLSLAGWIALVYALATASLYLPCGRLSDMIGSGKLFSLGFICHALCSLAAGFSQNGVQLIIFRGLQAGGSALIMANNFAIVTALFPPAERGRAMGISGGTVAALGYTLGPIIGGLLTHALGWRSNLYFTAALGFIGFVAARKLLPQAAVKHSTEKREPFDVTGALTFALAISLILLSLTTAQKGAFLDPLIIGEWLAGLLMLGIFIRLESRSAYPLLDLSLFRIAAFTLGNLARFASFVSISANALLMPFFLQLALGLDPLRAGLLVAPTPLALALLSPVGGWLSEKVMPEKLCALGMLIIAAGFLSLSSLTVSSTNFAVIVGLSLVGVGMGFFQTPNNNLLMTAVPRERLGVGSGFLSIVRSVGYSAGATLATTIVSIYLLESTGQTSLEDLRTAQPLDAGNLALSAFLRGYQRTYLIAAAIAFLGAVASAVPTSRNR
jgi:EmrB/QacA subfamily drug resistance transporter